MNQTLLEIKDKRVSLILTPFYRTNTWAEDINVSRFYQLFSRPGNPYGITHVEINFEKCRWIDPIPLMSLLTLIAQYVKPYNVQVNFLFSKPLETSSSNSLLQIREINRTLKFLKEEGFFDIIDKLSDADTNTRFSDYYIISELSEVLEYYNCHLCEAELINTEAYKDAIPDKAYSISRKVKVNLQKKKLSSSVIDDLVYKTRQVLTETLENVSMHAYDKDDINKYAMVYIRFRYGKKSAFLNQNQIRVLGSLSMWEGKNHPKLLEYSMFQEKEGFLEIFVVDCGKGIAESVGQRATKDKYPARKAFYNVIKNLREALNKPPIGGLNFLGRMLEKNFILSKDREEWLGATLPVSNQNNYYLLINPSTPLSQGKEWYHTPGCIWLMRISWENTNSDLEYSSELDSSWKDLADNLLPQLRSVYTTEQKSKEKDQYAFIDERFNTFYNFRDARVKEYKSAFELQKHTLIYFAPRNIQKNQVGNIIIHELAQEVRQLTDLVFVDIDEKEKDMYYTALNNNKIYADLAFVPKLKLLRRIVLVTRNLSCCVLTYNLQTERYEHNIRETENFIKGEDISGKGCNLYQILKSLKINDTLLLWNDVIALKKNYTFINSKVIWNKQEQGEKRFINGYLDFNQLSTIPKFNALFEIAFLRFRSLFSNSKNAKLRGIDPLVKNLSHDINSKILNLSDTNTIYLGSIIVTGSMRDEIKDIQKSSPLVHCFVHGDSRVDTPENYRLFIWPHETWIKNRFFSPQNNSYERVGKTHAVAPNGSKYYKVPRYNLSDEKSLYYRTPMDSYIDWQSEGIGLRIGNYEYDGYSELLKLDIKSTIDYAFLYYTDLAIFLFSSFFIALGGRKKEEIQDEIMRSRSWSVIESILNDEKQMQFYNNISLIAYPNHYYTDRIIKKMSDLLDKDFLKGKSPEPRFIDRIIQLNFIRPSNSNSSGLISPLTFNEIEQILENDKEGEAYGDNLSILLFDDAIVNGRTRKEIKHLLLNQFNDRLKVRIVKQVKTLSLIDRYRLPYDIPNPETNRSYWRLDIPRLGSEKYNPVNEALNKAHWKAPDLIPTAQEIITQWEKGWRARNPYEDDPMHGLLAENINLTSPYKKFGIRFDKTLNKYVQIGTESEEDLRMHKNNIRLATSIGALVYAIEMYCLTGRDDIAYNFSLLPEQEMSDKAKTQILCSFLLLFGGELRSSIRKSMLDKLIEILNQEVKKECSNNNNDIGLACITILNQPPELLESVFQNELKKNKVFNEELVIALAIALPQEVSAKHTFLRRIFLDNSNEKEWNDRKNFHYEIYENGNAHINILESFLENRSNHASVTDLLFCMEKMQNICENFPPFVFDIQDYKEDFEIMQTKKELLGKIEKQIELIKNNKETAIREEFDWQLKEDLRKMHKNMFYQLSSTSMQAEKLNAKDFFIARIIQEFTLDNWENIWKEKQGTSLRVFPGAPRIFHTSELIELINLLNNKNKSFWIPFDRSVKLHIRNLISNVMHGSYQLIKSPFGDSQEEAHLWYNCRLENDRQFIIEFANALSDDDKNYLQRAKNSIKQELYYCKKLECETKYEIRRPADGIPSLPDILICRFSLPLLK